MTKSELQELELSAFSVTHEVPAILNMLDGSDGPARWAELQNREEKDEIAILDVKEISSPREVTKEGDIIDAELIYVVNYVTISKPLIEDDTDVSL